MKKSILANIGIRFKDENMPLKQSINLHTGTKILFASVKENDNGYTLWLYIMFPSGAEHKSSYQEFYLMIDNFGYNEVEIDDYNHIGNCIIQDETCAIFYKAGNIIEP